MRSKLENSLKDFISSSIADLKSDVNFRLDSLDNCVTAIENASQNNVIDNLSGQKLINEFVNRRKCARKLSFTTFSFGL